MSYVGGYLGYDQVGVLSSESAPSIIIVSPPEGSVLSRSTPVVFQVIAAPLVATLRSVVVSAIFGGSMIEESVHGGVSFAAPYTGGVNDRSVITDGYQYTVLRLGGWRGSSLTLRIVAVDVAGKIAQKTVGVPDCLYMWQITDKPTNVTPFVGNGGF